MATNRATAAQEWRTHWPLVLAAMLGVSWMAAPAVSLGLFIEPLQNEFGWTRGDISFGMTLYAFIGTPLVPFAGALIDRFGSRRMAIPGLFLNGLAFAAFGLLTPSLWHWMAAWVIYTLTQLLIRSILWNRAVASAFSASRGLALGIAMAGIAIAQTIAPIISRLLIDAYGWRHAYFTLGIGWAGIALVFVVLFLRVPGDRSPTTTNEQTDAPQHGGLTFKQAIRDQRILRIVFAIVVQSALFSGVSLHIFPLLTGSGVSRAVAASMTGGIGLATLAGQIAAGWLADRVKSTLLPVVCFILPGIAYLLLLNGKGAENLLWLGVVLAGCGAGASINISTYLTSRYGGVLHFGKIYGLISSGLGLASGIGTYLAGRIFDTTGSYDTYLLIGMAAAALATVAIFHLGPYPNYDPAPES